MIQVGIKKAISWIKGSFKCEFEDISDFIESSGSVQTCTFIVQANMAARGGRSSNQGYLVSSLYSRG